MGLQAIQDKAYIRKESCARSIPFLGVHIQVYNYTYTEKQYIPIANFLAQYIHRENNNHGYQLLSSQG